MPGPIPTLGYPSQQDAIFALYEQRLEPRAIAQRASAPINVVHRSIHNYRIKFGRSIAPIRAMPRAAAIEAQGWEDDPYERAVAVHRRAVEGARKAREALQREVTGVPRFSEKQIAYLSSVGNSLPTQERYLFYWEKMGHTFSEADNG